MKDITIVGINYSPEDSSTGLYTTQMADYLSSSHNVSIVTGFPYYPEWRVSDEYKRKSIYLKEQRNSVNIYRFKQYVPSTPSFKKRILHLLSFTFGSIPNLFKIRKCDLVICIIPFTSSILLGLLLAKLRGAKVWVHIQDFEFDAAIESGLAGKQSATRVKIFKGLFLLEKKLLDSADIVSTISFSMIKKLKSKTKTKTFYFPNWVDNNFIDPDKAQHHKLISSKKFTVLYSGNIGDKQDWLSFIKVAKHMQDDSNVEFIVVGAGSRKEWLVDNTKQLANVKHHHPVPYDELSNLLCSVDLHILFQKDNVVDTVMPSKLLGMMASAKPSIVTGNTLSEVATILSQSHGGYFFKSNEISKIITCIEKLSSDNQKLTLLGGNARRYIVDKFSSDSVLSNFNVKITELLDMRSAK